MNIQHEIINATGTKFYVKQNEKEVARAYLYILTNDLHEKPFGFIEDVFVDETLRGQGIGSRLVERIINEARRRNCYKLICTSRHKKLKVHKLYGALGFKDHGKEFRIDF